MSDNEKGILVQTNTNGRKITLDPIRQKMLQIPCKKVESTIPCSLRQGWISGKHNGEEFTLNSGSGCGNPWIEFEYKGRGYCINAKDILEELFKFADERSSDE